MPCWHYYAPVAGGDPCFSVDASSVTFGRGALGEAGPHARALGCRRVALVTDRRVGALPHAAAVRRSLAGAGVDVAVYDEAEVEPDDRSFLAAARFLGEGRFDGVVSVGGGSVMDTAKGALLYATYPAPFPTYVNRPLGDGAAVPGPLPPHIACPTTAGTGSECTGIAVCTLRSGTPIKTGIAHRALRPTLALVDPTCTETLPAAVVAASGCDVLCHALESYTARPYCSRPRPAAPALRPMSQGANPLSDVGCLEALRLCGRYLLRAVRDAGDREAREQMMYAATLAGIAFGNAGVHLPHGMGYAVASVLGAPGLPGYPADHPLVPHGVSVMLAAPVAFRFTAPASPERHLRAAAALGEDLRGAGTDDAGEVLGAALGRLLRQAGLPGGLAALGGDAGHVAALADGAAQQARLLGNAPREVDRDALCGLFRAALCYGEP